MHKMPEKCKKGLPIFCFSMYKFYTIVCHFLRKKKKVLFTFHSLNALNFTLYIDILCAE